MPAESDLEKKIRRFAESHGCYTRKFQSNHVGVPDRIIVKNSLALFLEIKAPGKRPTLMQRDEINLINVAGGFATWVDGYFETLPLMEALINVNVVALRKECKERNFWMR